MLRHLSRILFLKMLSKLDLEKKIRLLRRYCLYKKMNSILLLRHYKLPERIWIMLNIGTTTLESNIEESRKMVEFVAIKITDDTQTITLNMNYDSIYECIRYLMLIRTKLLVDCIESEFKNLTTE